MIAVRQELGRELPDAGASVAFAVADHQVAMSTSMILRVCTKCADC
jgi:hypothetical protein